MGAWLFPQSATQLRPDAPDGSLPASESEQSARLKGSSLHWCWQKFTVFCKGMDIRCKYGLRDRPMLRGVLQLNNDACPKRLKLHRLNKSSPGYKNDFQPQAVAFGLWILRLVPADRIAHQLGSGREFEFLAHI